MIDPYSSPGWPGARYDLHCQISKINVMSEDREQVLGYPNVAIVMDVFSGLIAGIAVTIGFTAGQTALLALWHAIVDSKNLTSGFLDAEGWPANGCPSAVQLDGKLLSDAQLDDLVLQLGVMVSVGKPSTRVKLTLRKVTNQLIGKTPTLSEYWRAVFHAAFEHNATSIDFIPHPYVEPGIDLYPASIYRFGLSYLSGRLPPVSHQKLWMLLPKTHALISKAGITALGKHYTCKELIASGLLKNRRSTRCLAGFDPMNLQHIYVAPDAGSSLVWKCVRLPDFP